MLRVLSFARRWGYIGVRSKHVEPLTCQAVLKNSHESVSKGEPWKSGPKTLKDSQNGTTRERLTSRYLTSSKARRCFKQHACPSMCFRICISMLPLPRDHLRIVRLSLVFGKLQIKCHHVSRFGTEARRGDSSEESKTSASTLLAILAYLVLPKGATVCPLDRVPLNSHECAGKGR